MCEGFRRDPIIAKSGVRFGEPRKRCVRYHIRTRQLAQTKTLMRIGTQPFDERKTLLRSGLSIAFRELRTDGVTFYGQLA